MIGKIIGAAIGHHIDRRDGKGGLAGALIGAATPGLLRRAAKVALLVGGLYVAKTLVDKARGGDKAQG